MGWYTADYYAFRTGPWYLCATCGATIGAFSNHLCYHLCSAPFDPSAFRPPDEPELPAEPPMFCEPGCSPAAPCRTPVVCPALVEDQVERMMSAGDGRWSSLDEAVRMNLLREWLSDGYECRALQQLVCSPVPTPRK